MEQKVDIPDFKDVLDDIAQIGAIKKIIEILMGENGCPWDHKQTPKSIMSYLVEETYELADAIDTESPDHVCEELGDVLFQILFIAHLYSQMGHFTINDVAHKIASKMIQRHPHVFGDQSVTDAEAVKKQWQQIKRRERQKEPDFASLLATVPSKMPALMRAYRISERAAQAGFDWDNIREVLQKTEEEWREFHDALEHGDLQKISVEFGDILFTLTNVARFAKIHPETALRESLEKFIKRFQFMEETVSRQGQQLESLPRPDIEALWNDAKKRYA